MIIPKRYFHDRLVLVLLTVGVFLSVAETLAVLIRLSGENSTGFIVQYRANLGIDAFKTGTVWDLLMFVFFSMLVLVGHIMLSMRTYPIHRQLSVAILALAVLLLLLAIIVSNALLILR
jgi:hypothetical protein